MKVISTISNNNDWYLISADFVEYIETQELVIIYHNDRLIRNGRNLKNGLGSRFLMG